MERAVQQWLERVRYDLGTAKALLKARRYLYASFMCQQAVEKALKALLAKQRQEIPLIHNLRKLAILSGLEKEMGEREIGFLEELTPFAIKARYGTYKQRLSEICDRETASRFMRLTTEFISWVEKRM